jgi:hypothetical protein
MPRGAGQKAFRVGFVGRDGFLDHDVQAGFQRLDPERCVLVMRCGDEHRVDLARADQRRGVAQDRDASGAMIFEFAGRGRADGTQDAARDLSVEKIGRVVAADVAHSDESEAQGFHVLDSAEAGSAAARIRSRGAGAKSQVGGLRSEERRTSNGDDLRPET